MGYRLKPWFKNTLLAAGAIGLGTLATQGGKIAERLRPHGLPEAPAITCMSHVAQDSLSIVGTPHKTTFGKIVGNTIDNNGDSFVLRDGTVPPPIYEAPFSNPPKSSQEECQGLANLLGEKGVITVLHH
ncbi:MAG: hypothetical protein LW809_04630 [Vampirovibrionales bacterium]|jgi:hypothetical protein|nr:hypothetical protein [Vampirovibrionales bacterium]